MARLRVLKDGVELHNVEFGGAGKAQVVLGRAAESDIRLEDRAVGREHAVFVINSNGVVVQKKSKFGKLSVNGADTAESVIKPGDVISIADYLVRFEDDKSGASAQAVVIPAEPALEVAAAADLGTAEIVTEEPAQSAKTAEISVDSSPDLASDLNAIEPAPVDQDPGLVLESSGDVVQASAAQAQDAPADGGFQMEGIPAFDEQQPAESDNGGEDRTAMIPQGKVISKLVFKAGDANVQDFIIKKSEVSLGRGTNCDVILNDKKSSRKHLIIKRVGMSFVAKDLGSVNGTYVNGVRINEQELAGDDVIRIGDSEFSFKAESLEYMDQQADLLQVPPVEQEQVPEEDPNAAALAAMQSMQAQPEQNAFGGGHLPAQAAAFDPNAGAAGIGAIPGMAAGGAAKKETLVEKFKRQPLIRKLLIAGLLGFVLVMALSQEEPEKRKTDAKPKAAVESADAYFKALPAEKKQFVINTYQLAFDLYKKQEYERAIYEIDKLLQVLPTGYKEAKEIKNYATKAIETVKAAEEERRRKEAEEKLRAEIAALVARAQELIDKGGHDAELKEIFGQVLEKDPDNPTIMRLRQQLEEKEQRERAEVEAAREVAFKRKQLEQLIKEGRDLFKAGKYYEVMSKMEEAPVIYSGDEKLLAQAKDLIVQSKNALKEKVRPHLEAARTAMSSGDLIAARDSYYKALKVDYKCTEAKVGLGKIKDILHDRSKRIYADAVMAESLSEYAAARAKFKECLDGSMREDVYYGRCLRKYKRYDLLERGVASEGGGAGGSLPNPGPMSSDPQMPSLPKPVELNDKGEAP